MKKAVLIITILLSSLSIYAQTGAGDDFESGSLSNWDIATNSSQYACSINTTTTPGNKQMYVTYTTTASNYSGFSYIFNPINIEDAPVVSLKVRASSGKNFTMRIDLIDENGLRTNQVDTKQSITGDNTSKDYLFDFTGKFQQLYPSNNGVPFNLDVTKIVRMEIMINPGAASTTGWLLLDSVMIGTRAKSNITSGAKGIKLNQLGFFINGPKKAVINGGTASAFYIVNTAKTDTLYTGALSTSKLWSYSSESVRIADFSDFKTPGTYRMLVPGIPSASYPFTISQTPLNTLSKGSIKGFYYQRASMALKSQYAGVWSRAAGHPDNQVVIHNSAASPNRPTGSKISSPRGWYDAGDYNKYIVNSGISTYTLLACYEHFSTYYDTLSLNIPESSNTVPDVLDEALYNVRWMLTMQDPSDGGVYHKLTNANFDGDNVMPSAAVSTRYVVQKSTGATLDFAAVMAQSARIYAQFPTQFPQLADSCLRAAKKAYEWAILNPSIKYVQSTMTSPAINTGEYGDYSFTDEFNWAASELFTTTQLMQYYDDINLTTGADLQGWQNVNTLGWISIAHNRVLLGDKIDTTAIKNKIIGLATAYRNEAMTNSAYGVAMGAYSWNFGWGSNSSAANQAMILVQAFNYTKDSSYLKAATSNVDYLLGRNAVNYSFVTGYGFSSSNHPHHRVSQADGVNPAVPGLLVGGPNPGQQDNCAGYPSSQPALSYVDSDCSYSTNEIAINWNAPLAYITGAIQSIYSGIEPVAIDYTNVPTSTINSIVKNIVVKVYPNPTNSILNVEKPFELTTKPTILDLNGKEFEITADWSSNTFQINTSQLSEGMYLIRLQGENGAAVQKFTIVK